MIEYNLDDLVSHCTMGVSNALVIIGTDDTCLYTNSLEIDNLEYTKIWDESESAGAFELDDNYMAEPVLTRFQDIRCIIGIPQRAQLTIRRLLITVIVLASISTLLGLSILLLNLWHNILNPLESLIKKQNSSSPGQNKIIHSLTNSFREMEQDRDLLQKERDYLMPLALGRYLTRLREASNPGEASAIADLCLNLTSLSEYSSIAVFAVCCVVDKNQYLDSTVSGNNVSITTLHFLLDNVLRDILFNQYPGTVAPLGKNSFAVIVGCEDANQELIEERAAQLVEFFQQQIDTQIISTETYICSGASEFTDAVKDIYQEITFLTFWEQNNGDDDNISEITGFYQRCHCIRKIISELTKDNADESFAQLDRLVRGIVNSNETDAEIAKYRLYALTTYIVTSIEEYLGGSENMGFAEKYEHSLFEAKTISEYNQQLQAFLLEALQAKESIDRTVFISNRMNEVKQYLKSHFRENSLNVASVAAQFGISVSYLSRSFKSAYNINILEYIQRLRVNEAKKMLLTDTVQNVAHEVGFWDAQALIRSFKKFEGINPGDYKRLSENEHSWN